MGMWFVLLEVNPKIWPDDDLRRKTKWSLEWHECTDLIKAVLVIPFFMSLLSKPQCQRYAEARGKVWGSPKSEQFVIWEAWMSVQCLCQSIKEILWYLIG